MRAGTAWGKLNLTDQNVKRFVLGTYADAKDVFKRPLTMMKQDIMKQLMK